MPVYETPEFQEFQKEHANLEGYQGTVVVDAGPGRFLTLTLWRTGEDMAAGRESMGAVVERTLNPLMSAPANLLGTGPVVVNDLLDRSPPGSTNSSSALRDASPRGG